MSDGREYLEGAEFTLSDIAWMPNVHRFKLMDWPFERTPHVQRWFENISKRPSYREALLNWQAEPAVQAFSAYTKKRQAEGADVRSFPHFRS
ncbi:MAG: glutathione S-transferase C-terminal domain-containing protein [Rhizobiaceae bacterium]|nr:glutathione S-transferase C-terminal domain-containing protein [Rhizobiaceae bacterium]